MTIAIMHLHVPGTAVSGCAWVVVHIGHSDDVVIWRGKLGAKVSPTADCSTLFALVSCQLKL